MSSLNCGVSGFVVGLDGDGHGSSDSTVNAFHDPEVALRRIA
jgi:hypothetical protein